MQYDVNTVDEYLAALPENRRPAIEKMRSVLLSNLSAGYTEEISSGMINYVIPLSKYPKGYHVKKKEALPFVASASQKTILRCIIWAYMETRLWNNGSPRNTPNG